MERKIDKKRKLIKGWRQKEEKRRGKRGGDRRERIGGS